MPRRVAGELSEGEQLSPAGRVVLIAVGKAARPLARRALQTLTAARAEVVGLLVPANGDDAPMSVESECSLLREWLSLAGLEKGGHGGGTDRRCEL